MVRFTVNGVSTDVSVDLSGPDPICEIMNHAFIIAGWGEGSRVSGRKQNGIYYVESGGETVTAEVIDA